MRNPKATEHAVEVVPPNRSQAMELTVEQVGDQINKIQLLMKSHLIVGTHYGKVPGTEKDTLFKAGAEKICFMFRLAPTYDIRETWDGPHMTVNVRCDLIHIPTGQLVGSGHGMGSTKEAKYAWRKAERTCPKCGKPQIIKGKAEYGGGWLCFAKRGGCGAKFPDGDKSIEGQQTDRIPNPDLPDTFNTVVKMACKRAHVAATLTATAASDVFTQDLEEGYEDHTPPRVDPPAPPAPAVPGQGNTAEAVTQGTLTEKPLATVAEFRGEWDQVCQTCTAEAAWDYWLSVRQHVQTLCKSENEWTNGVCLKVHQGMDALGSVREHVAEGLPSWKDRMGKRA